MNDSNSPISEVNRYVKFVSDTVEGGTFKAEGSFDDIYIPPVTNYVTYKGIKDENNVIEKSANGKVKTGETPISKIGEEPQLTFPHDDYVEYMVYLTKSDKPQPSPNPQPEPTPEPQPNSEQSSIPTNPEPQPVQPVVPNNPENPIWPTTPVQPSGPTTQNTEKNQPSSELQLPQTGSQSGKGIIALGFTALMASLGLGFKKKKNI